MRTKKILLLIGSVCLAVMLAVPLVVACAAPTPTPTPTPAPEKVTIRINLHSSSTGWLDISQCFIDKATEASGGRFEFTRSASDAIVPVDEHLDALRDGIFDIQGFYLGYYIEKMPLLAISTIIPGTLRDRDDYWAFLYKRGLMDLLSDEYAKWNIHSIYQWGHPGDMLLSRVPIPHATDIKGLKIRSAGNLAMGLDELGASTLYVPGSELYTSLATGLMDACTYGNPASNYGMGFHEVTKYWVMPALRPTCGEALLANADFWNSLSDADRAILEMAAMAAGEFDYHMGWWDGLEILNKVQQEGVTINYWDDKDLEMWMEAMATTIDPHPEDPALAKGTELLFDFLREVGYIE